MLATNSLLCPRYGRLRPARRALFPLTLLFLLLLLGMSAASVGCQPSTDLHPATSARLVGEDTVMESEAGVTLVADVDSWTGHPGVLDHATPLWVTVENQSEHPLELRYEHFALVASNGERLVAMAPSEVQGGVVVRDVSADSRPEGLYVPVSGAPVGDGAFDYDDGFYDYYDDTNEHFSEVSLPTAHMVVTALEEGVLQPGESASGYLYFRHIDDDDLDEDFRAIGYESVDPVVWLEHRLIDPDEQRSFGMITIPFEVD